MTIEEFRGFGWKAGMEVKSYSDGVPQTDDVEQVDFIKGRIETLYGFIYPEGIAAVHNPDGTVAWRKE